ncbi:MAG TPA: aspartate kinase [Bryobacteraceae bacterium]|nr:aspartate kinase [Bryobacteraceae bacterium]
MKFGGSSVASPTAIRRVASIVQSQVHLKPVVVVSAMGTTTNKLSSILQHASAGESYLAWKLIKELREFHFCVAEDLLSTDSLQPIDQYLRETFRDLHVRMAEVGDGERQVTPEETDWVLSLGEQLSSRIVTAAFVDLGIPASHFDARKLILTDDRFNNATPRYWETYAKIRWTVPHAAKDSVVVLGGFMGATEKGQTTTLGRGGSDLTASIVGAAINADEIQIWKDVDGMLTCDPRLRSDGYLVKTLSYDEAAQLAKAGAKILHPETVAPAQRLHIPIALRNTFNPEAPGTTIAATSAACANPVKSIVCKSGITLLEIHSPRPEVSVGDCSLALRELFVGRKKNIELLGMSDSVIYLAVDRGAEYPELQTPGAACMEVHLRSDQALITLVGDGLTSNQDIRRQLVTLLSGAQALLLPQESPSCALRIVMPANYLSSYLAILHNAFFAAPDIRVFARPSVAPAPQVETHPVQPEDRESRKRHLLTLTTKLWALRN